MGGGRRIACPQRTLCATLSVVSTRAGGSEVPRTWLSPTSSEQPRGPWPIGAVGAGITLTPAQIDTLAWWTKATCAETVEVYVRESDGRAKVWLQHSDGGVQNFKITTDGLLN